MTLNASSTQVAEADRPSPPHLRVCRPVEQGANPAGRSELKADAARPMPVTVDDSRQNVFTDEELALISLFADGLCVEAIARRLELSDRTIRRRSRALCDRLGVVSSIQVVAWAARRQLI